jgi:outer membrane lipoprotein-sorting protein
LASSLSVPALLLGVAPLPARSDDLQAFLSDSHRFAGLRSFRLHLDSTSPKGHSVRDLVYVAPDKLRVEIKDTSLVVVVIGTNVWLRGPDKKWTKGKLSTGNPFAPINAIYRIVAQSKTGSVHFSGTQDVNGTATHVYQIYMAPQRGFLAETTRVWIGLADGFPRRIEERNGPYTTTAIYSDWNQPTLTVSGP